MTIEILKEFNTEVQEKGSTKTVTYSHPTFPHFSGVCEYDNMTLTGVTKPIRQNIMIMVRCDMGDIIECIHKKSPLVSEDILHLNKIIRDHSLSVLMSQG